MGKEVPSRMRNSVGLVYFGACNSTFSSRKNESFFTNGQIGYTQTLLPLHDPYPFDKISRITYLVF
jgi:hypothetical protein